MREFNLEESTQYINQARNGAWKGLLKGALIGLAVGAAVYFAGIGLAGAAVPGLSEYLATNMGAVFGAFSKTTMLGFAAFNGLFFGISGAISGAAQARTEALAESRTKHLESAIKTLQEEQGMDNAMRRRTEVLLDAVETEAVSSSRTIQEILSKGPSTQGNLADKVLADSELAEAREAAI